MRAYQNIRFIEGPDVYDIRIQGRKTSVGRLRRGEIAHRYIDNIVRHADGTPGRLITKTVRNDRGYTRPHYKSAIRRYLKRVDRALSARFEQEAE
jgi:hypothetical protein